MTSSNHDSSELIHGSMKLLLSPFFIGLQRPPLNRAAPLTQGRFFLSPLMAPFNWNPSFYLIGFLFDEGPFQIKINVEG